MYRLGKIIDVEAPSRVCLLIRRLTPKVLNAKTSALRPRVITHLKVRGSSISASSSENRVRVSLAHAQDFWCQPFYSLYTQTASGWKNRQDGRVGYGARLRLP